MSNDEDEGKAMFWGALGIGLMFMFICLGIGGCAALMKSQGIDSVSIKRLDD